MSYSEQIKQKLASSLELLYDEGVLTRDNVNIETKRILSEMLGEDYDDKYNVVVNIKSFGGREFTIEIKLEGWNE
jgi:hypothetical protein